MTMGVIVGNRGFFPDHLAKEGRDEITKALTAAGIEPLVLSPQESKHGAVETRVESRKCADLFRANRDRIDGVIVTLPNFGEERAIADTLRPVSYTHLDVYKRQHFEPSTRFQCMKPIPVRIPLKDKANECTLFQPRVTVARDGSASAPPSPIMDSPSSPDAARSAFDKLFKK